MDPFTIGALGIMSSIGSAGLGTVSALNKGASDSAMYGYQAGVAGINAEVARKNAEYALHTGDVEARNAGLRTGQDIGKIISAQGGKGMDVGFGSNRLVQGSQRQAGLDNQSVIMENASRRAYGFNVEAENQKAAQGMYTAAASTSRTAGTIGAIGSIIGGIGSVSSKWMQGSAMGLWGSNSGNYVDVGTTESYNKLAYYGS